jgi:hypothetical protein
MTSGGWLRVMLGQVQLRHGVPTEVDLAVASFNAAVALTTGDALAIAGESLTAAAAQLRLKG